MTNKLKQELTDYHKSFNLGWGDGNKGVRDYADAVRSQSAYNLGFNAGQKARKKEVGK